VVDVVGVEEQDPVLGVQGDEPDRAAFNDGQVVREWHGLWEIHDQAAVAGAAALTARHRSCVAVISW
jgi:hypothetical protein